MRDRYSSLRGVADGASRDELNAEIDRIVDAAWAGDVFVPDPSPAELAAKRDAMGEKRPAGYRDASRGS